MSKPKVSVIVPCYNQGEYVKETLRSVQVQTFQDLECIVINDGSTDNSSKLIQEFCAVDNRFKYLEKKNEGVSIARNCGILHSEGDYILPLDADDLIDPEYIEECIKILDSHPEYKIVYSRMDMFGTHTGECKLPEYTLENLLCSNCIQSAAMFRRKDFEKTKGYNPNMKEGLEDWDFWISFLGDGGRVYKIDKILFHYRQKENSRNRDFNKNKEIRRKLRRQMWLNNRKVFANSFMDPLSTIEYLSAIRYKDSLEYKIGYWILYPLRKVKYILSQI